MSFRVVNARHVHAFVLWLKFSDGAEGELDLRAELDGLIIDPGLHTLVWPNETGFAPEFLHATIRIIASYT
jgi:hypothetical protein